MRYALHIASGGRAFAAATGLLLLATTLGAQTMPVPALPREPPPEPGESALTAVPPDEPFPPAEAVDPSRLRRPRPWEYALGAGLGWDGNIDFLVPKGPSGVAVFPRGGVSRVFWHPRRQLRAFAAGGWTGHPDQDLGRYAVDFGLDGTYRRSPGTTWRAQGSYGIGHSDSSPILLGQGVALPVVKTRSLAGSVGVSTRVGARTSLRVDGRFYRTQFDSPALIDGDSARATVALERPLSARGTLAIEYSLEDVFSDESGRAYLTHFASVQWTRAFSLRSALLAEAGSSYTPDAARARLERKQSFFGGLSFTRRIRRSGLTVFVRREVTPAFGLGVSRLVLRGGVGSTIPIGRAWELRIVASHVQPDTAAGISHGASSDAFAALGRSLGRHLELSSEARYRRRAPVTATAAVEAFQAGLFLTLRTPSGRAIVPGARW